MHILIFIILILIVLIIYLFVCNNKLITEHSNRTKQLQEILVSLRAKQKLLNDKIIISDEFKSNYSKEIKLLGDEIVQLQKVFIDIISNGNYN